MRRLTLLLSLFSTPAWACTSVAGLPDPLCSPGTVDPTVTQENIHTTICVPGYSKRIRPPVSVTYPMKRERMAAYGLAGADPRGYELDHLVSLELGGAPTSTLNLWPEPWNGPNNAHDKDRTENALHRLVCIGTMSLQEAQHRMATNWRTALDNQGQEGP